MRSFIIALLLLFVSISFADSSSVNLSTRVVSCGSQINESLTLPGNLVSQGGNCITINTSNVVLDCAGYYIRGYGSGAGVYAANLENVTVKNCRIYNFTSGLEFRNDTSSSVLNNTLYENREGMLSFNATYSFSDNNTPENNSQWGVVSIDSYPTLDADELENNTLGKILFGWVALANVTNESGSGTAGVAINATNSTYDYSSYNYSNYSQLITLFTTAASGLTDYFIVYENSTSNASTVTYYNNHTFSAFKAGTNIYPYVYSYNVTSPITINFTSYGDVEVMVLINGQNVDYFNNTGEPYNVTVVSNFPGMLVRFREENGYLPFALPQYSDSNVSNYGIAETYTASSGNVSFTVVPAGANTYYYTFIGEFNHSIWVYQLGSQVFEKTYTVNNINLASPFKSVSIPNSDNIRYMKDYLLVTYDRIKNWNGGETHNVTIYSDGSVEMDGESGWFYNVTSGKPVGFNVTVRNSSTNNPIPEALVSFQEANGYQPFALTQYGESNVTNYAQGVVEMNDDGNSFITLVPTGGVQSHESAIGTYNITVTLTLPGGADVSAGEITNEDRAFPEPSGSVVEVWNWDEVKYYKDYVLVLYDRVKNWLLYS